MLSSSLDFTRSAISSQIQTHDFEIQQSVGRHSFGIGVYHFNRQSLEKAKSEGKQLSITAIEMLQLAEDIPQDSAADVIEKVRVLGVFRASEAVKETLADLIE